MQTLQEQYNQIKEGKGNKAYFLKQARYLFPNYINQYSNFNDTVNILKGKNILSENKANLGIVSGSGRKDWFSLFEENIKAEEKKVSKEVTDIQAHGYDYKDMKNIDNVYGNTFLNGFYTEMQDPKNKSKTPDQLKQIVAKNLGKDWNYYATKAQFGIKGIGYTKEAPGLGEPKEPKGKWKASGYGELPEKTEKVKANTKDTLGEKEAKTTMPKKVEEMPVKPQNSKGVKKMPIPGKPKTIKLQESMEEFKVGDTVYPNVGPHKGQKHEIIAVKSNGYNIKPVSQNNIKYRLGAVMATKAQLSKTPLSETSIQESNSNEYIVWIQPEGEEKQEYNRAKSKSQAMTIANNFMSRYEDDYNPPKVGIMAAEKWENISKMEEGIRMFLDPIGYQKPEPNPKDKIFTKKFVGTSDTPGHTGYIYDIYKNGEKVKTIEGEGNANAWINNEMRKLENNMNIQESKLRSVIRSLIKEELDMKEIDNVGKMAEYEAKIKKIEQEIAKRKKKIKALNTLEEIEEGSTNKDMLKSLKKEIKTLESLKMKLDKKFTPKEEVIGEEENIPE